ncbi:alpha/beta hydrolase [Alicyclobacillus ferrooxydans]|uniref:alpha/beta hydrolase n=1 Tax=Alicyclobacillus ferrooxydans TaxID=471514 RepID=UPI0006D52AF7|nr:alpha/beta fold hydrolase [Alicyclobacillus ferrooxydans]
MAKGLCVLIHGFTGTPEELAPLAEALLAEGYDVELPVLPGHCGSKADLETATASQWLQAVEPVIEAGLAEGPVHLIGFSMGAMIASVMAAKYPVTTVTMLAPAVFYVGTKQLFRQIAGVIKESWDKGANTSTYLKQRIERVSQTPLKSVKQFRRIVQLGKTALPQVTQPLCVIQGEMDEVVEPRGASYVYHTVGSHEKEIHWLPQAGHMVCYSQVSSVLNAYVIDFLKSYPHREEHLMNHAKAE